MPLTSTAGEELLAASEHGRICALAAGGQRDLQRCATTYPALFPPKPFDPALFSTVSLATAFGAPWCGVEQLRISNRAALWVFAADWLIDYLAESGPEVTRLVIRCLSVADGAVPAADDPLGQFLAEIRDELALVPAFATLRPLWREELRRMLAAMAREWEWKREREQRSPTFADYLANADNFGSSFVNVSHWIFTGDRETFDHLAELTEVGREVQRVLRLVNDLATYQRDVGWGDFNALMLTPDRAEVSGRVAALVERCRELLRPLEVSCPRQAEYLVRQIGFSSGFYRVTDFWGSL